MNIEKKLFIGISKNKIHIATAANDEYMEAVVGLIKSAYRKSSNPSMIQFEVFLTTNQDSTMIQNLQLTNEYLDNSWSIRLHLFDQNDVDIYVNKRWKGDNSQRHLKNANNYVRFILFMLTYHRSMQVQFHCMGKHDCCYKFSSLFP